VNDEPRKLNRPVESETAWITTFSGLHVRLPDIDIEQVRLRDIAHSIGLQCRYMGHCSQFYSVAEHSVLVSELAQACGENLLTVRCCLLHDVHEAFVGDFPSPLKRAVPELGEYERKVEVSVHDAFGLPYEDDPVWKLVKHYDIMALHMEAVLLLRSPEWVDDDILDQVPGEFRHGGVRGWNPEIATEMFMRRCTQLSIVGRED